MKFTNTASIPPLLAGWLSIDEYDYNPDDKVISATTLLKPVRQMILTKRYAAMPDAQIDLKSLIASRVGTAVHDAVERAWVNHLPTILNNLNIPKPIQHRYVINPDKVEKNQRPIYLEQRHTRKCGDWTVSGKFDAVIDGQVNDVKYTKVYSYTSDCKEQDYAIQGSVYRWLVPHIITNEFIKINYVFGDFKEADTYMPNYPPAACAAKEYQLYDEEDTGNWIAERIEEIAKYMDAKESDIPHCTPEELWLSASVFKYYKNPESRKRSTANFDTHDEALARKVADKNVGVIVEVRGTPKACLTCAGAALCTQKDIYIADGSLKM